MDDARWWLTQDDGQLQVANICFTNFSYNRVSFSNDSGEHRFELGTFSVRNLMPNTRAIYQVREAACMVYIFILAGTVFLIHQLTENPNTPAVKGMEVLHVLSQQDILRACPT